MGIKVNHYYNSVCIFGNQQNGTIEKNPIECVRVCVFVYIYVGDVLCANKLDASGH